MPTPAVTIILPTFNRAAFLKEAFGSIAAQTWKDWELIVIDDGSTDETRALCENLTPTMPGPVRYIYQPNGGAAAARNTGIRQARGRYVAFFDSDDLWLPHHLADCVRALDANPEVDWVFGAGRREEIGTGRVVRAHSFHREDGPRPLILLQNRRSGPLHVITDPHLLETMIGGEDAGGLQASVFRAATVAGGIPNFRVGEDFAFGVRAVAGGARLGYLDDVHVVYRMHSDQTSNAGQQNGPPTPKRIETQRELIRAVDSLRGIAALGRRARRTLRRRLAHDRFWKLGYGLLLPAGLRDEALAEMGRGLRDWPWDFWMWKTFLLCKIRR